VNNKLETLSFFSVGSRLLQEYRDIILQKTKKKEKENAFSSPCIVTSVSA
jgi:hypothetical protein